MRSPAFLARFRAPKRPLPTFTPLPGAVRATAPIRVPAIRVPAGRVPAGRHVAPGRVRVARTDPAAMEQALHGIGHIDWASLDAARAREGLTHAGVRQANVDPLACPDWPANGRVRHGEAARRRVEALAYPPCDITAPDHAVAYIALMRQLDRITGTQGRNRWALPALPAGSDL
jgi:hypothetical protein